MGKSNIEWTDETWNPTIGCTRVSEGCRHCYAEGAAFGILRKAKGKPNVYDGTVRLVGDQEPRWTGVVKFLPERLAQPLGWRRPRRVFVNSMSDLFHDDITNEQIAAVFGVMAACPHTFQVLTKRPERMREWFAWMTARIGSVFPTGAHIAEILASAAVSAGVAIRHEVLVDLIDGVWPLLNVWLGVSVEDQAAADERIPHLLATPAAVRFLSCEPLLGPIDVGPWLWKPCADGMDFFGDGGPTEPEMEARGDLHWVIAGCESGPGARECDVSALLSLLQQCEAAGVPFFAKQWRRVPGVVEVGEGSKVKPGGVVGAPYVRGRQRLEMPR